MDSLWTKTVERTRFQKLQGNVKTDVLIIGGGITGILCAYALKNAGVDCALVEATEICGGITKNTTAKITLQHGLIYDDLIKKFGKDYAQRYLQAQKEAVNEYARLCRQVSCDYEQKDSYVYSLSDRAALEREVAALQSLGFGATLEKTGALPFQTVGAVRVPNQAQFHPLKFAMEIAKTLSVYENTRVIKLLPDRAVTTRGEIICKKVIVATHFPIFNRHGAFFLKMYQDRSYVLALKDAPIPDGMYVDEDSKGLSFRNHGSFLLLGGGSHRTGKQGGGWKELEEFARRYYPKSKTVAKWATQDCMTLDGVAYIGNYAKSTPDLYVATGFNKWGMTSAMVAAKVLRDLILERKNEYASIFSPSRSMLHPQLAVNVAESLVGLLTPSVPRCPHLGCALKYNPQEHSWDCSCHGSRFDEHGNLIDNPATDGKAKISQIKP